MAQVDSLKFAVEQNVYGVCERLGEKLQMPAKEYSLVFYLCKLSHSGFASHRLSEY
jgi:hypothetical protein